MTCRQAACLSLALAIKEARRLVGFACLVQTQAPTDTRSHRLAWPLLNCKYSQHAARSCSLGRWLQEPGSCQRYSWNMIPTKPMAQPFCSIGVGCERASPYIFQASLHERCEKTPPPELLAGCSQLSAAHFLWETVAFLASRNMHRCHQSLLCLSSPPSQHVSNSVPGLQLP